MIFKLFNFYIDAYNLTSLLLLIILFLIDIYNKNIYKYYLFYISCLLSKHLTEYLSNYSNSHK